MTKKAEIVADLKTLLEAGARTKMGKVWEVYDELLELRQSGVSVSDIEAKLNSRGFNLKPGNLTSYMHQIKKKKERENTSITTVLPAATSPKKISSKKPRKGTSITESLAEKPGPGANSNQTPQTVKERQMEESKRIAAEYSGTANDGEGSGVLKFL